MGKRKTLTDEEREKLAINFLVMRRMWQIIRKRAPNGENEDTIYNALGMSRTRYTRAIDRDYIYISEAELKKLSDITGLSMELFQGKACFHFKNINYQELKGLLEDRGNGLTTEEERVAYKKKECEIFKKLAEEKRTSGAEDEQFYRLCYFIKERKPIAGNTADIAVKLLIGQMKEITVQQLEECSTSVLENYVKQLHGNYTKAKVVRDYRKITTPIKKKQSE